MKARLQDLVGRLRRGGVAVSVAESMDAARAAAAVGIDRTRLRDALAAVLIKDEGDRPLFDEAFAVVLPARPAAPTDTPGRRRRRAPAGGAGAGPGRAAGRGRGGEAVPPGGRSGSTSASGGVPAPTTDARDPRGGPRAGTPLDVERERPERSAFARAADGFDAALDPQPDDRGPRPEPASARAGSERARDASHAAEQAGRAALLARSVRRRALRELPIRTLTPDDVDESTVLVDALARRFAERVRRRLRPRRRGRLDLRRTLRAAVAHGGVPFERRYRARRPARVTLVALCDLSDSAATATDFFLRILAPAVRYFAAVRLYGFVDRLVEIEFVAGQVRPAGPFDLMARSDFGRVLGDLVGPGGPPLGADTLLLVLGDARNNRRPARADRLARARSAARRVLWLNPEPAARWNTGDSAVAAYARHVDAMVACGTIAELDRALAAVARL